jgi:N-acetylmuramoyl-L-alanine amidase
LAHWQVYSPQQLEAAREVGALLVATYNLVDVIGHDDIAPGRKVDPGPAFPMETFRSQVMGRENEAPDLYLTTSELNIRTGAGVGFAVLPGSPLPKGTRVERLRSQADWFFVDVHNGTDLEGWVHSRYLTRV